MISTYTSFCYYLIPYRQASQMPNGDEISIIRLIMGIAFYHSASYHMDMKKYLLVKHLCEIAPLGGIARAKSMTKERRREIAMKANKARWSKQKHASPSIVK